MLRRLAVALAVLLLWPHLSKADPVNYAAGQFSFSDLSSTEAPINYSEVIPITDPSSATGPHTTEFFGNYPPYATLPPGSTYYSTSTPLEGHFAFYLGVANSGTTLNPISPSSPTLPGMSFYPFVSGQEDILVQGTISGTHDVGGVPIRNSGMFTTTITSVSLDPYTSSSSAPLPLALADLVGHPERIHLSGAISGGAQAYWDVSLSIDPSPAVPVPEPATFLAWGGVVAAVGLGNASRRRISPASP